MPRNEGKVRSGRKPLRDIPNSDRNIKTGEGNFSKSLKAKKEKKPAVSGEETGNQLTVTDQEEDEREDAFLDRLLLVQSDLSSLTRQIDELVAEAFKLKATTKEGRKEIDSFRHILSDMLSSLKPWVPRFQKVLSSLSVEPENQWGQSLEGESVSPVSEKEKVEIGSPEETKMISLISPSPLVSW
uniref:Uncharacterized protein n=2 Tax=Rhizophora mucronata TaxID=61149 RepID=A0A2P2J8F5_RHIMU